MKHTTIPTTRLLLAAASALLLGACAAETAASDNSVLPGPALTTAPPTVATTTPAPSTTTELAPDTTAPTTAPPTVATTTPPPDTTAPPVPPTSVEPVELPEAVPAPPAPCGDLGPLPALPDSMPTRSFDTDGDGEADDLVTAYGAEDGWRVRVVEDDVVSEATAVMIPGWAYLEAPIHTDGGDQIELVDNDSDARWHFATDETGCVQPHLDPPDVIVDGFASPDDDLGCGPLPKIPADAIIGAELTVDHGEWGQDLYTAYFADGVWMLRADLGYAQSEIAIPGAGVHGVELLGVADVDHTYGGDELLAVVGGGASTVEIGIFSLLEGGCLFRYQSESGGDFGVLLGATTEWGEGMSCADGLILDTGYQREEDDTYTAWSTPYQPVSLGTFGLAPDVDGYDEADLSFDDVDTPLLACGGLAL